MTRVLVVDDQRVAREYMEHVVREGESYELVGSLASADMAVPVCLRNQVDLVLMDVCTRGVKDGITVAAELRREFPKLKIIVVTSMPEESFIKRAREAGAGSFWHKEVSLEELITVMGATMRGGAYVARRFAHRPFGCCQQRRADAVAAQGSAVAV